MQFKKTFLAIALMAASAANGATTTYTVGYDDQSTELKSKQLIQQKLLSLIPNAPQAIITPSVVKGLFQVIIGPKVVYMSGDGKYLIDGDVIDLNTKGNLTVKAQQDARKRALARLDPKDMIIYPAKGVTKHVISVFTDIDCPYCHKLHQEIPKLNNAGIEVRYLSYPRAGLGSESYHKAVTVWCSKDRAKAMTSAMSGKMPPSQTCVNPVAKEMHQATFFGVNGTPNIILDSGEMVPGYVPAERLIQALNRK